MSKFWYVLPVFFLAGCAGDSDVVQVAKFLFVSATAEPEKISRDSAAAVPYATMGMELGSSSQVLLTLGTSAQGELDWFAGDQVFVRTRHGRVIRTIGLVYDLGGLRALTANGATVNAADGSTPKQYLLDFPDLGVYGATAQCSSRNLGDDNVEILGAPIATHHIVEHCTVPTLHWDFDNEFWEDRTSGYIWRSIQHIHPKSPPLILEVFRPEQNPL